jgi:hypothetical protein
MLAFLVAAALAPCAPETPPALALTGIPPVAIPGRTYEAALTGDGEVVEGAGSDFGVTDTTGRGWSAHYGFARGVTQAFSVGIERAPFTVSATWTEPVGADASCTRTVTVPLPIERRILAVVDCGRAALEPRSGLVLRCRGDRLRLRALRWKRWNADVTVGRGRLGGRDATVTLSAPRACDTLDGFIYTRAKVAVDGGATLRRVPIACPLP